MWSREPNPTVPHKRKHINRHQHGYHCYAFTILYTATSPSRIGTRTIRMPTDMPYKKTRVVEIRDSRGFLWECMSVSFYFCCWLRSSDMSHVCVTALWYKLSEADARGQRCWWRDEKDDDEMPMRRVYRYKLCSLAHACIYAVIPFIWCNNNNTKIVVAYVLCVSSFI